MKACWFPVAVIVLLLAGCGQTVWGGGPPLHLTAKDDKIEFIVQPRQEFDLTLPSNWSTGYRWVDSPKASPAPGLSLISHRFVGPKKSVPGAPGKEIWRYRVVGKGSMKLGLEYRRAWERDKPPAQEVEFTFSIG